MRALKRMLQVLGMLVAVFAVYVLIIDRTLPDVTFLVKATPARTSFMRHRAALNHVPEDRYVTEPLLLESISPLLACAVIKAEDRGFFRHHGFEWSQIMRATEKAVAGEPIVGASTMTQQLARNLFLVPDRSLDRKLREALLTRRIEDALSKHRVLEIYLDVIEWGDGIWGAAAATRHYFGKEPAEVDAFEATFLASLIAAPRSPPSGANGARMARVQGRVLFQFFTSGLIDQAARRAAVARAQALHDRLAAGMSLEAALAVSAAKGSSSPALRRDDRLLPLERAVLDECGLDREFAFIESFKESQAAAHH